ncbi:hypothetical protein PRIPAC_90623 [Pristionchus pacificus]|uniref:Uncharacterized protein n=1 Tax=Pristionchus pacificus TaxID=54126 RepID=A0A2A6B7B1_PRIPA|nr:hypothetical protein PRIPAC_90623 [Pristionchus pacificus]|eukprot:PDM61779.1 hypothetical protein PRIPAC_51221 [Pristionchus pacificus]
MENQARKRDFHHSKVHSKRPNENHEQHGHGGGGVGYSRVHNGRPNENHEQCGHGGGFPGRGFPGGPRGGGPPVGHPMAPSPFMGYDPRMGGGRPPGMGGAGPGGRPPQQMTPGSFPVAAMRPPPPHMQGQQMPPQI